MLQISEPATPPAGIVFDGLEFFRWAPTALPVRSVVLIVSNAYGVLEYACNLGKTFAEYGHHAIAFNFRGQGGSPGTLQMEGAAADFATAYEAADREAVHHGVPVVVLVHCSGLYAMLLAQRAGVACESMRHLLIYSYLAHPERLFDRTRRTMARLGVRAAPDLFDTLPTGMISPWRCKTSIVHPRTTSSLLRASVSEALALGQALGASSVATPDYGYELVNESQSDVVRRVCEEFYLPQMPLAQS